MLLQWAVCRGMPLPAQAYLSDITRAVATQRPSYGNYDGYAATISIRWPKAVGRKPRPACRRRKRRVSGVQPALAYVSNGSRTAGRFHPVTLRSRRRRPAALNGKFLESHQFLLMAHLPRWPYRPGSPFPIITATSLRQPLLPDSCHSTRCDMTRLGPSNPMIVFTARAAWPRLFTF